jgi:hypothetical protein
MAIRVFSFFSLILFVYTNVSANQEKKENIVRKSRCHQQHKKRKTTKESVDIIHINGNIGLVIQQIIITAVCDHMYSIAIILC